MSSYYSSEWFWLTFFGYCAQPTRWLQLLGKSHFFGCFIFLSTSPFSKRNTNKIERKKFIFSCRKGALEQLAQLAQLAFQSTNKITPIKWSIYDVCTVRNLMSDFFLRSRCGLLNFKFLSPNQILQALPERPTSVIRKIKKSSPDHWKFVPDHKLETPDHF